MNNRSTILQAIAEGGNCGGNYNHRWDINGDGDFDDGNEIGVARCPVCSAGGRLWASRSLFLLNQVTVSSPVEVDCAGQRINGGHVWCVLTEWPNPMTSAVAGRKRRQHQADPSVCVDRIVDRALWWMFNSEPPSDDGRRGGIPPAPGGLRDVLGSLLNAFASVPWVRPRTRRGHVLSTSTYCGLNALVGTYHMAGGNWFDDDAPVGMVGE